MVELENKDIYTHINELVVCEAIYEILKNKNIVSEDKLKTAAFDELTELYKEYENKCMSSNSNCDCKSVMTIGELKDILSKYKDDDKITIFAGTTKGFGYGEVNIVKDNGEHGELVMCYQDD